MDARRESEPTPMKNRTTVERKSERASRYANLQRPGAHRVRGVDHARAAQAVVGPEVDRRVPAFLRGGCSCRGQLPFRIRPRGLKAYGVLRQVHRSDTALAPRLDQ